jgi:diguanylate cyclase (GGDEF)-like protein
MLRIYRSPEIRLVHYPPPCPADEEQRLIALRRYRILDTEPEPQFDRLADMARRRFGVPIALVAFMDEKRNFLKARGDLPMSESPRDISFCGHAILHDKVMVVKDATSDARFAENPLVCGDFHIRFYAGAPLVSSSGYRIGTICVFDTEPHESFNEQDARDLEDLAALVCDQLEMRLIVGDVYQEIQTRRAAEAEAHRIAFHDGLTGLPNRTHLQSIIAEGLPFPVQGVLAALAIDLDDFKGVNDALGNDVGDELLRKTTETIRSTVGARSFLARINGDEFIVLLDGSNPDAIHAIAQTLAERLEEPLLIGGHILANSVSIGLAFAEPCDPNLGTLLKNAEYALRAAKRSGRGRIATYDRNMAVEMHRRAWLVRELVTAVHERAIEVYFQPIHKAADGTMIGVEALARWHHHELGWISPAEFIPLAEENGKILELGEWILRDSLRAARDWGDIFVSVNLSPVQFKLSDLAPTIALVLKETQFPASRLQLEVTEGVLLHDLATAKQRIAELHNIGVGVSLDDFGTGYSSLNYLAELPFDKIKLDRGLVTGACRDGRRVAIINHIIRLARELDMRVTAEGVEAEEEVILLTVAGCTSLQGYHFGRPMPAHALADRLKLGRVAA